MAARECNAAIARVNMRRKLQEPCRGSIKENYMGFFGLQAKSWEIETLADKKTLARNKGFCSWLEIIAEECCLYNKEKNIQNYG